MLIWRPFCIFYPIFLPEVDDIESWVSIQNLVVSNTTLIPNYKKIWLKLWPWQCPRFFDKYGGRDVINYVNELKLKRTQLDIKETLRGKFHWCWLSSFGVLAQTDTQTETQTHTHTHTDRQTYNPVFSDPNDPNTFSQWNDLECKNDVNAKVKSE